MTFDYWIKIKNTDFSCRRKHLTEQELLRDLESLNSWFLVIDGRPVRWFDDVEKIIILKNNYDFHGRIMGKNWYYAKCGREFIELDACSGKFTPEYTDVTSEYTDIVRNRKSEKIEAVNVVEENGLSMTPATEIHAAPAPEGMYVLNGRRIEFKWWIGISKMIFEMAMEHKIEERISFLNALQRIDHALDCDVTGCKMIWNAISGLNKKLKKEYGLKKFVWNRNKQFYRHY